MVRYQFIGKTSQFFGKPLWEVLGNLKNHGVGRMIVRNSLQRYPEPCYYRILKVAAWTNPNIVYRLEYKNQNKARKCAVLVEEIYRGVKNPEPFQLFWETFKEDFALIPKDEEHKYINAQFTPRPEIILPRTMELPPLMKELVFREMKAKGIPIEKEPEMEVVYNLERQGVKNRRLAEEGEKPTKEFRICLGLGKHSSVYSNCKPI